MFLQHFFEHCYTIKMNQLFDVVTCVGPNDQDIIKLSTLYTRANVVGHRRVYLVCSDPTLQVSGCITVPESIFPFSLSTVSALHGSKSKPRHGWYFQQLLKLYAGFVIPDILPQYLVVDADTLFINPTTFLNNGKMLYATGTYYHKPCFKHMKRLHPSLKNNKKGSGVVHHMMFDVYYLQQLFRLVEGYHGGAPFYEVFLSQVAPDQYNQSGASEYEIFFNYMLTYHPDAMEVRQLKWDNVETLSKYLTQPTDYNFISYHYYLR